MGDPAESPAPPKKRLRWRIAAFALALISFLTWWHWPQQDARFVGNWRTVKSWDSRFQVQETEFYFEPEEVAITPYERPPTLTIVFRWKTAGDELTLQPGLARIDHVLSGPMAEWLNWIGDWFRVESTFQFRFADDANSVVFSRDGNPVVSLQRILE